MFSSNDVLCFVVVRLAMWCYSSIPQCASSTSLKQDTAVNLFGRLSKLSKHAMIHAHVRPSRFLMSIIITLTPAGSVPYFSTQSSFHILHSPFHVLHSPFCIFLLIGWLCIEHHSLQCVFVDWILSMKMRTMDCNGSINWPGPNLSWCTSWLVVKVPPTITLSPPPILTLTLTPAQLNPTLNTNQTCQFYYSSLIKPTLT